MHLEDIYLAKIPEVHALAETGEVDAALSMLDSLLATHAAHDHDRWLARAIARDKAVLLEKARRLDDALNAYAAWAELGFADGSNDAMENALGTADVLAGLQRKDEALQKLLAGLDVAHRKRLGSALRLLVRYVDLAEPSDLERLEERRELVRHVFEDWGLSDALPEDDPGALASAVRSADSNLRAAKLRFDALHRQLTARDGAEDGSPDRARLIRAFVDAEPVGYYRMRASHLGDRT